MDDVTKVFQVLALLLCWAFPIRYALRTPTWRRSAEGWYLMLSHIGFSLILSLGVVTAFVGQSWTGRPFIRLLTYIVLCTVFSMPHVLLSMRNQRRRRKPDVKE